MIAQPSCVALALQGRYNLIPGWQPASNVVNKEWEVTQFSTRLRLTSSCDTHKYIQRKSMVIQAIASRPADQSNHGRVRQRLLFGVPRGKGAAKAPFFMTPCQLHQQS